MKIGAKVDSSDVKKLYDKQVIKSSWKISIKIQSVKVYEIHRNDASNVQSTF